MSQGTLLGCQVEMRSLAITIILLQRPSHLSSSVNEVLPYYFPPINLNSYSLLSLCQSVPSSLPGLPPVGLVSNITARTGTRSHTDTHHTVYKHTQTHRAAGARSHTLWFEAVLQEESWWRAKEEMRREEEDRERFVDGCNIIFSYPARYNDPLHYSPSLSDAICSYREGGMEREWAIDKRKPQSVYE